MHTDTHIQESLHISSEDMAFARERSEANNTSVEHELLEMGLISPAEYSRLVAHTQGVPHVSLLKKHIDPEVFTLLPEPFARMHRTVAFAQQNGRLSLAASLITPSLQEALTHVLDTSYDLFLTDEDSISKVLGAHQAHLRELYGSTIAHHAARLVPIENFKFEDQALPARYIQEIQDSFDAHKIIESLFGVAETMGARDIYIDKTQSHTEISIRFGAMTYPTMRLDSHIFDRLLWAYGKHADINITNTDSVYGNPLPTPKGFDGTARISLVKTHGAIKHIHIALSEYGRLFGTIESILPSAFQSEALRNVLGKKNILIFGDNDAQTKKLYYSLLEEVAHHDVRTLSYEKHVEVDIPRVMQLDVSKKDSINTLLAKSRSLHPEMLAFADTYQDTSLYAQIFGRTLHSSVVRFNSLKSLYSLKQAIGLGGVIHGLSYHVFNKDADLVFSKLSQEEKQVLASYIPRGTTTIDFDQEFGYAPKDLDSRTKKEKRLKVPTSVVWGYYTIDTDTKASQLEHAQKNSKAAILEHALMRSAQGDISIEQILKFLKS